MAADGRSESHAVSPSPARSQLNATRTATGIAGLGPFGDRGDPSRKAAVLVLRCPKLAIPDQAAKLIREQLQPALIDVDQSEFPETLNR